MSAGSSEPFQFGGGVTVTELSISVRLGWWATMRRVSITSITGRSSITDACNRTVCQGISRTGEP
jgi:hypothetical protein